MLTVAEAMKIVKESNKVAMVGLSPKPDRPSHHVAAFLQENSSIQVTPINPTCKEVLGEACVSSLENIEAGSVDWIDFFVNPTRLPEFTAEVLRIQPRMVWCQIGVVNEEFGKALDAAGIPYIMDKCPKIEWNTV